MCITELDCLQRIDNLLTILVERGDAKSVGYIAPLTIISILLFFIFIVQLIVLFVLRPVGSVWRTVRYTPLDSASHHEEATTERS